MSRLSEVIRKFIAICRYLNPTLDTDAFLTAMTGDANHNYVVFQRFAGECSNTILTILYQLGHCAGDKRLIAIIADWVSIREEFGHHEEDEGGYIAAFRQAEMQRSGKIIFYYLKVVIIKFNIVIKYNNIFISLQRIALP